MAEQTALESVEARQAISQSQGERLVAVETLLPTLATKTDIANLRTDNANLRTELKEDNANLRTELKADISNLNTELKADISGMGKKSASFQSRVDTSFRNLKWFVGIAVAAAAIAVTVINIIVAIALALILRAA